MALAARPLLLRQAVAMSSRSLINPATISPLRTSCLLTRTSLSRHSRSGPTKTALFHSSARLNILPPKPQKVQGTANEAAAVPEPAPLEGSYHWSFERFISIVLIPLTVAPFVGSSMHPMADAALCGTLVLHSHMGFSSAITDYFPRDRVPNLRRSLDWVLIGSSVLVSYALWEFETNDVGITEAVHRIWKA